MNDVAKVVNVTMPEDLIEAVNQQAKLEDRPRSSVFREALRIYLALKQREMQRNHPTGATRRSRAERTLNSNVIALNKVAMSQGLTEADLLRIGQEVREELYQERYGAPR